MQGKGGNESIYSACMLCPHESAGQGVNTGCHSGREGGSHALQQPRHLLQSQRLGPHRRLHSGGQLCGRGGGVGSWGWGDHKALLGASSTSPFQRRCPGSPGSRATPPRRAAPAVSSAPPSAPANSACLASCTASTGCSMESRTSRRVTTTGLRWVCAAAVSEVSTPAWLPASHTHRAAGARGCPQPGAAMQPSRQAQPSPPSTPPAHAPLLADAVHARHRLLLNRRVERGLQLGASRVEGGSGVSGVSGGKARCRLSHGSRIPTESGPAPSRPRYQAIWLLTRNTRLALTSVRPAAPARWLSRNTLTSSSSRNDCTARRACLGCGRRWVGGCVGPAVGGGSGRSTASCWLHSACYLAALLLPAPALGRTHRLAPACSQLHKFYPCSVRGGGKGGAVCHG